MKFCFLERIMLSAISKVQKFLLKMNSELAGDLYYYLAKKHYEISFGSDLEDHVLDDTIGSRLAAKRHGRFVVNVLYKHINKHHKKMIRDAAEKTFISNIILNVKL